MTYYLDITESLRAVGCGENIAHLTGETVYSLRWEESGRLREGFASARNAAASSPISSLGLNWPSCRGARSHRTRSRFRERLQRLAAGGLYHPGDR